MEPGELNVDVRRGTLSLNGFTVHSASRKSWCCTSLLPLVRGPSLRGSDRLMPHTTGAKARRKRKTVSSYDLTIVVTGLFTPAGVRAAKPYEQLVLNIEALIAGIGTAEDAPAGTAGTVAGVWTLPSGGTRNAAVHPLTPIPWEEHGIVAVGPLTLEIPLGKFS